MIKLSAVFLCAVLLGCSDSTPKAPEPQQEDVRVVQEGIVFVPQIFKPYEDPSWREMCKEGYDAVFLDKAEALAFATKEQSHWKTAMSNTIILVPKK